MGGVLKTAKAVLPSVVVGALVLYFSYHAVAGDQGLSAWGKLQDEEAKLEDRLAELAAGRDRLEASLVRLRDRSLDLDYVEEIARTKLSFVKADELLVSVR